MLASKLARPQPEFSHEQERSPPFATALLPRRSGPVRTTPAAKEVGKAIEALNKAF